MPLPGNDKERNPPHTLSLLTALELFQNNQLLTTGFVLFFYEYDFVSNLM